MADTVAQIKSRLNLSDVIGGYLKLQKTGANFKARCPFHNEKTPSFHINTERQIWHCFGCNKGGDVFSFVQDIEGIDFPEALRILAGRAGVPLERLAPGQKREHSRRGVLLRANALARAFFGKQLWHSTAGKRALEYLRERGMTDDTIRNWQIGWAPNDWQALNTFMRKEQFPAKDLTDAGLTSEKSGRLYDRFRGRIMFPINDHNGQTIGFAGRIFGRPEGEKEPKYINTPQTPLYDKSKVLFGLDKAKMAIREKDACILVEGNTDAIMASQDGAMHAVATSGTALTGEQLRMLGRYTKNLQFCFDADVAGAAATRRGITLAIASGMNVHIATLDDESCKDPAEYVRAYPGKFSSIASAAKPVVQHYLDESLKAYDPSSAVSKKAILASVGPFVKQLTSRVERSHWISRLATVLRTPEEDVRTDISALKHEPVHPATVQATPEKADRAQAPDPLEQALLSLLMKDFGRYKTKLEVIDTAWLNPETGSIIDELKKADPASYDWDAFIKRHDKGTWQLEFAYVRAEEAFNDLNAGELDRQWNLVVARLGQRHLHQKAQALEMEIKAAEDERDQPRLKSLLTDFSRLRQDIARLFRN